MFEWKGFAKFWLWFCLIVNARMIIVCALGLVGTMAVGTGVGIMVLCTIAEIAMVVGLSILLFKKKKFGFYIVAATAVLNIILNAISGQLVKGIASAIISLVILFFAIKSNWNDME